MKNFVFVSVLALATLGIATAQTVDFAAGDLQAVDHFTLGVAESHPSPSVGYPYSNVANFTGQAFLNGGAVAGGAPITKLVADDCTFVGLAGQDVTAFTFSVANLGPANINARARVRFWYADGAGGGPGTYYNQPAAVGFSFNAFSFAPGVTLLTGTIGPNTFKVPTGTLWCGLTFDNNSNTTGATAADLNNLGQGTFDPPTVGSSADRFFQTTAPGSFFTTANPAGTIQNFNGNPVANFGWRFEAVPEPGTMIALGAGAAALLARRRRRNS